MPLIFSVFVNAIVWDVVLSMGKVAPVLLQLFKSMQPLAFLLLPLYAVGLHVHGFLYPLAAETNGGWLYDSLRVGEWSPWWISPLVTLICVCGVAFVLVALCSEFRITRRPTVLPGLGFILLTAASPKLLALTPSLFVVALLLLIIRSVFSTIRNQHVRGSMYASGLWSGISILLLPHLVVLPLVLLLAIPRLRRLLSREILIFCVGVLVPFWLLWVYFVWCDQPMGLVDIFSPLYQFSIPSDLFELKKLLPFGIFGAAFVFVIIMYGQMCTKREMAERKQLDWFLIVFVGLIGMLFLGSVGRVDLLFILALPLGVLLGEAFSTIKNSAMAEVVHLVFLFAVVFSQYSDLLLL